MGQKLRRTDVADTQPDNLKVRLTPSQLHEITVFCDNHAASLSNDLADRQISFRSQAKFVNVFRLVASPPQPPRQSNRKLLIDEDLHSAAMMR